MLSRSNIFFVIIAITVTIALLYATPIWRPSQNAYQATEFSVDLSYKKASLETPLISVDDYTQAKQGSFFLESADHAHYLLSPTVDTTVDIKITGLIARVRVTQHFFNPSNDWLNGIYVFPLPEGAAVDHLTMQIGERLIEGKIKPKQQAKKLYEKAKQQGKKASLLVQSRPNLFTNSVANIGPQEHIKVTIEYQEIINVDNQTFSLRFPTTITERFMPKKPINSEAIAIDNAGWSVSQPSFSVEPIDATEASTVHNKVSLTIALNAGFALSSIDSPSHAIDINKVNTGQYQVSLQNDVIANQDFVLHWQALPSTQPVAAHFSQQSADENYGVVLLLPPQVSHSRSQFTRQVTFIIDTSGSMAGESITQAQQALISAIDDLTHKDSFNIVQFNSIAAKLFAQPVEAHESNKQRAKDYVLRLKADGGTNMLPALQLAFEQSQLLDNTLNQLIFITDGAVGNETELFNYIGENIRTNRLFTVGIGSAPNSYFMTEAALAGKGTYTYVNSSKKVQEQMQGLFEKLSRPALTNLTIDVGQPVEIYPKNLPDLYHGQPLLLSYRTQTPVSELDVRGEIVNQVWRQTVNLAGGAEQSGLNVLWARRKIAHLDRQKYQGADIHQIDQHILDLAMTHHIVSSMTSLIAIDVSPTTASRSTDRRVKNRRPKGQILHGQLPQTATSASLQFVIAVILLVFALCLRLFSQKSSC